MSIKYIFIQNFLCAMKHLNFNDDLDKRDNRNNLIANNIIYLQFSSFIIII